MVMTLETVQRRTNATRRRAFDASVKMLKAMGFAPWAVDYFTEMARALHCLPHEIIVRTFQSGVVSQLEEATSLEPGREVQALTLY